MRIAVLSDLHANLEALQAVLAHARGQDCAAFVCLGDIVGYNANPRECLRIIRELGCPVVKGNHDEQAAMPADTAEFNELARQALQWTRDQLSTEEQSWLKGLPLESETSGFTIVHSTLDAPENWGYVFDDLDAAASFVHQKTSLCFFGHTHVQGGFVRGDSVRRLPRGNVLLEQRKRYFFNAGSVGQPRDGDWRAAYAIVDLSNRRIEPRRVSYDVATARDKVLAAGLPPLLAERLLLGR